MSDRGGRLEGKVSVVTGGGSGIGRAISLSFAKEGAEVIVLDLASDRARDTAALISEAGGQVDTEVCDVSNATAVRKTFASIHSRHGGVEILVNSAGIAHIGNLETTPEEEMDRVYSVNVKGVYNCMRAAIGQMAKGAVILNMASIASKVGLLNRFAYSMSKGAVLSMTLSVARDYLERKIRCNCICPARVHTPFVDGYLKANYPDQMEEMFSELSKAQPIGRMAQPEEVAHLTVFLCSDEAAFITGVACDLDGGVINLR